MGNGNPSQSSQDDPDSISSFWAGTAASAEEMSHVVRFALKTAVRSGELPGMTWEMVDLKKTNNYVTGYEKQPEENSPPRCLGRGSPQGTPECPQNRRESLEYRSAYDITGFRQDLPTSGNFRASFSRSSPRSDIKAF